MPHVLARFLPTTFLALAICGCSGLNSQDANAPMPPDAVATGAPTSDAAVRSAPVVPGRPARVFIFTAIGDNCEALSAPQLTISAAPAKGDLKFVPGQETTIQTSKKGTCIGRQAKGTGLYYTARDGQSGTDRFTVSAKLGTGEEATRTFEVHIAN